MIPREDIEEILTAGCQAPSGSNSQPWRFEVKGDEISAIALPEKDHPIFNIKHRGTWVAHGALIENIVIAASHFCYGAKISVFPESGRPNVTARIVLTESGGEEDILYDAIFERSTNRKKYNDTPLTKEQRIGLLKASVEAKGSVDLKLLEDKAKMKALGEAVSVNEIVMLENKKLHKLFFEEIVWTKEEEARRKSGLYLKTAELKPPQEMVFKLVSHWGIMHVLRKIGFAKFIARDNAKIYASGAVVGIITSGTRNEDFIAAGRMMQRVWLTATKLGLSFHLITGVLYMRGQIKEGDDSAFSEGHKKLIEDAYQRIADVFGVRDRTIALLFRIGEGGKPSAYSTKKAPEVVYN